MIEHPFLSILLRPLAALYAAVARVKELLYRAHWLRTVKVSPRLVSVGNLTVGGAGKTPFTICLARRLQQRGQSVAVLSHGWKRDSGDSVVQVSDETRILVNAAVSGDEAQLMARQLPGVPVVVGASKWRTAQWIEAHLRAAWIVLDDGYQHLALARDSNILLLDADRPFDNGRTIPCGRLRESVQAVRRADVIVLIERKPGAIAKPVLETLSRLNPGAPLFRAHRQFDAVTSLDAKDTPYVQTMEKEKLVAFCGLAQPQQFFESLKEHGMDIAATLVFPDHHRYRRGDTAHIIATAIRIGATALITTAKDAVNLPPRAFGNWPCLVYEIKMVCEEADRLMEILFSGAPLSAETASTRS